MMLSSYPMWWWALPVLLLPVWWHRRKRQRLKAEPLATARFLPAAAPEQLRVWQWRDKVLLLVRCLMLIALIAWLAATIFPWRGDTVLVGAGVDRAWAERQIESAGFSAAARIELPQDALQWLRKNERDWRADAKLLIVARADQIAMPARVPQFAHQLELRTQSAHAGPLRAEAASSPAAVASSSATVASSSASAPPSRAALHVTLAAPATREAAWRSLFAAFGSAGDGANRYQLATAPDASTQLIIWDQPSAPTAPTASPTPPADWHAAHWWITTPSAFPELANASTLTINGITLKYADSPRGRLWTSESFPPRDADRARALYEAWQQLASAPAPAYAMPSQTFAAARSPLTAIGEAKPAAWLAIVLLALFMIERILAHARRN